MINLILALLEILLVDAGENTDMGRAKKKVGVTRLLITVQPETNSLELTLEGDAIPGGLRTTVVSPNEITEEMAMTTGDTYTLQFSEK